MREHKYQAWHKSLKRMYDILDISFEHKMIACSCQDDCETGSDVFFFDEVELLQFTGLEDKHGREVYEGSIVQAEWHWTDPHQIVWPDDYYDFVEYGLDSTNIEVIGNAYEHPELIKPTR